MKLYKFRSFDNIENKKNTIDIIKNEHLFCAPHNKLNDPFEGLFSTIEWKNIGILQIGRSGIGGGLSIGGGGIGTTARRSKLVFKTVDQFLSMEKTTRICSLSCSMADVKMWSIYAAGHTGCVIEVELEPDEKQVVKVKYGKGLQHFKKLLANDPKAIDVLSFKTDHWEYEKEYRIFSEQKYYPVQEKITGIYLGFRIQDTHKQRVVSYASKKIPIYTTKLKEDTVEAVPKEQIN